MFGNIRKRFNNALQEGLYLSENLSTLHLKVRSSNSNSSISKSNSPLPTSCTLLAGTQILRKYENEWEDIHNRNEDNAVLADQIDQHIIDIRKKSDMTRVDLNDLNSCLMGIPALQNSLKSCVGTIHEIRKLCEAVEVKIVELEDICEECEMQEKQLDEKFQISLYKNKKMVELEAYRQKLATKHDENVKQYENELRKLQLERQAVFEDAFRLDMEDFKKKGALPKLDHKPLEKGLSLEEVELDPDSNSKDDLEHFLTE